MIIPALNEASNIGSAIASAQAVEAEVLVVDGGSSDNTATVARGLGVRVLLSPPGRGRQLAAGAAVARGEILVFLHADAQLPPGYCEQVCTALTDPQTVVGAFRLRIAAKGAGLRLVEWGVRQRCRWLSMPYGDQGLFMLAETYRSLGGFREFCAMEDIDFVRRAHRRGKILTLWSTITVSPRAWQRRGVVRFALWNTFCATAWFLGVGPERIAKWRSGLRRPQRMPVK